MKFVKKIIYIAALILFIILLMPSMVFATRNSIEVTGRIYEFDEKSEYKYSESDTYLLTDSADTYGNFTLNGNVVESSNKDGIAKYEVQEGYLDLTYTYDDTLLKADIDSWHLYEDGTDKIDGKEIGADVQKGTILIYTSIDKKNWTKAVSITNAFSTSHTSSDSLYTTKDLELINGCYYKVVIAYGTRMRKEDSNFLFFEFDYKKYAEVYEFYAYTDSGEKEVLDYAQTYNIGSKVRVEEFDGYYGEKTIEKNDPHYGWDLGNFFVSGYTDKRVNDNGNVVFLKNVGDKVILWFNLSQNMEKLNGKDDISITADSEGFDKYFETPKTDFGNGTLIVRYTDYNNNKSKPQIYTNYLKANTSFGTDTKVQLFEEGDYEVALDYEVTKDDFIDSEGHYRIFFKFSVRNGNCMVYPFDLETGEELTNSSMTENGFLLDLAKSRYLQVNLKREVMKDSANGLVEDTRFNEPAKDGAKYADDGIYTITVNNQYTNQSTIKKIYVGTNNIMRAYMTTGLSIPEINNLVAEGATINADGTIQLADKEAIPAETEPPTENTEGTETTSTDEATDVMADVQTPTEKNGLPSFVIPAVIVVVVVAGAVIAVILVKKKSKTTTKNDSSDTDGGDKE